MKTRRLVLALGLALAAGASLAALNRGGHEAASPVTEPTSNPIPRVVVTATPEIPRVVVIGKRPLAARS